MPLAKFDWSACPYPPTQHQRIGVAKLVRDPWVFVTDEMGMGKSKQVIDAAQILFEQGTISRVIIIAPAAVKPVWFDPELGQLRAHCWARVGHQITHYHRRPQVWSIGPQDHPLEWVVTNYEYIRTGMRARSRHIPDRLAALIALCGPTTLLVLDESSAVKTSRAYQTRACGHLRRACGRVALLTGTPIAHSPLDLLSQGNLLHPSILSTIPNVPTTITSFRSRYCVMGGWQGKQILRFHDLDDLQRRFAPYTLRRLKKDCLDLPPKLDSVSRTATLTAATWARYKKMRAEMIVHLQDLHSVSLAQQTITKLLRLSQLTSGYLGGVENLDGTPQPVQRLSHEKLDLVIAWVRDLLDSDPNLKLLLWSRFRVECERLREALGALGEVGILWGGSPAPERDHALRLLHPQTAPAGPAILIGTPQTGSMGITLAAAHTVGYVSNSFSLNVRVQSEDRTHRPGQRFPVSYTDFVATGPDGQRTIDHIILSALHQRRDLADWTAAAWVDALSNL